MPGTRTLQLRSQPLRTSSDSVAAVAVDATIPGTSVFFAGFLALLLIEYLGLKYVFPILIVTRFPTLLAWTLMLTVLVKVGPRAVREFPQNVLLTVIVVFTLLSIPLAIVQMYAFEAFRAQLDYFGLFIVTLYLLDRVSRIRQFCMVAATIILYLVATNLDKLGSATRSGGYQGGYFLTDGNDFAWCLNVLMPLALFLFLEKNRWPIRLFGGIAVLAAMFGIVGTQSRGATVALVVALLYFWATLAKRKVLTAVAAVVVLVGLLSFAPSTYFDRMKSISSYAEDNSAMARLQAWSAAVQMALDHPLGVGAGNFSSAYGRLYIPNSNDSMLTWGEGRWISAHSVYFKMLGEYGFPGLALLLSLIGVNVADARRSRKQLQARAGAHPLPHMLPGLISMAIIAYAVAGAFLGGVTYPHIYILSGVTAAIRRQVAAAPAAATAPGTVETAPPADAAPVVLGRGSRGSRGPVTLNLPSVPARRARQNS